MADTPADTKKDLSQVVSGSSEIMEQAHPRSRRKSTYDGPNQEFLQMLMTLGISKNAAEKVGQSISPVGCETRVKLMDVFDMTCPCSMYGEWL